MSGLAPAPRFRPGLLARNAALAVEDLLEDLAHPRAQQVPRLGVGVVIPPPYPGLLARVDLLLVHGWIVDR